MITCRQLVDFLLDYYEETLGDAERRHFEQHLAACPPCRDYVESYRTTVDLSRLCCKDDEAEMPDELVEAILAARRAGEKAS